MPIIWMILATSGILTILSIWRRSRILLVMALLLALSGGLSGLSVMEVRTIRPEAESTAAGRPYCLALPSRHRPVRNDFDLTPLIARGNRLSPHLMLWIEEADAIKPYVWSYWRSSFQPGLPGGAMRNCRPNSDFLDNPPPVAREMQFALGEDYYIIPPEYSPTHANDDYFSLTPEPGLIHDAAKIAVERGEDAIARWRTRDAQSSPTVPGAAVKRRSEGKGWYIVRDFDERGDLIQKIQCKIDVRCRLEFSSGPFFFDVFLPPTAAEDLPKVRTDVEALWLSFRQSN